MKEFSPLHAEIFALGAQRCELSVLDGLKPYEYELKVEGMPEDNHQKLLDWIIKNTPAVFHVKVKFLNYVN